MLKLHIQMHTRCSPSLLLDDPTISPRKTWYQQLAQYAAELVKNPKVPPTKQKHKTENKQAAVEHKAGFGNGSERTRGIVTGIREVPKGMDGLKKSQGCNELRREWNKVQTSSGDWKEACRMGERTDRPTRGTDVDSGRI